MNVLVFLELFTLHHILLSVLYHWRTIIYISMMNFLANAFPPRCFLNIPLRTFSRVYPTLSYSKCFKRGGGGNTSYVQFILYWSMIILLSSLGWLRHGLLENWLIIATIVLSNFNMTLSHMFFSLCTCVILGVWSIRFGLIFDQKNVWTNDISIDLVFRFFKNGTKLN